MKDRVVELLTPGTRLSKHRGLVQVDLASGDRVEMPIDDFESMLVLSDDVIVSTAVFTALSARGVCTLFCDERYTPTAILTPLVGHHRQQERLMAQSELSKPFQDRIWRHVVIQKIKGQARLLKSIGFDADLLEKFAQEVKPGDPQNLEAQAARAYWPKLFGESFSRGDQDNVINAFLNYGYAVVRASTARAVIAAGLNPGFGIHHSNKGNPFCLVDDLMEIFRPAVDQTALRIVRQEHGELELNPQTKKALVGILETPTTSNGQTRPLRSAIVEIARRYAETVLSKSLSADSFAIEFRDEITPHGV